MQTCMRAYFPRPNTLDGFPFGRRFDHGRAAGPWQWEIFDKVKHRLTA